MHNDGVKFFLNYPWLFGVTWVPPFFVLEFWNNVSVIKIQDKKKITNEHCKGQDSFRKYFALSFCMERWGFPFGERDGDKTNQFLVLKRFFQYQKYLLPYHIMLWCDKSSQRKKKFGNTVFPKRSAKRIASSLLSLFFLSAFPMFGVFKIVENFEQSEE